jgi:hypothetical protein
MKKLLALSMVLVMAAGAVFAEIAVTGQVDAVVIPLQVIAPDEGDTLIGAGVGRDATEKYPRARIGVSGGTEQVGINFKLQLFANGTTGIDDFLEVWWKPISQLKIEAGKFVNDTLRGKIGDDNWQKYTVTMKDPDAIFSRFKSNWGDNSVNTSDVGFMLGLTPIEPLFIGVAVPKLEFFSGGDTAAFRTSRYTYTEYGTPPGEAKTVGNIAHTYEKIQIGAGYTIGNIGLFRAQYVGASYLISSGKFAEAFPNSPGTADPAKLIWLNPLNVRRIEAAFAFTGVEGVVVDLGAKIPLEIGTFDVVTLATSTNVASSIRYTDYLKIQAPYQVSLGAGYTADALDIKGRVDAQFGGSIKADGLEYTHGVNINVHLWPSYNLGFATAGLDVGFELIGENETKEGSVTSTPDKGGYKFGIGAWLKKAYGASTIKGGLALSLGERNEEKLATVFTVPVIFEYSF